MAALCCAASLRFPDLRWGPVKVGCIKGRVVTKGQSPKAVLLLSPTYVNRVKFDWIYWISRFFSPFFFSWITMRMYSRSGATMISLDSEGCNDKTCGLKDRGKNLNPVPSGFLNDILYDTIYASVAVNLGHPLSWAAWCSFLSAMGNRSTHLETDLELRNRFEIFGTTIWRLYTYVSYAMAL